MTDREPPESRHEEGAQFTQKMRSEVLAYLIGTVGSSFFLYLAVPVYTRAFPPDEYGALAMVTAVVGVVGGVVLLGGDTALSRFWFMAKSTKERGRLSTTWIGFLAVLCVLICLVLALAGDTISGATLGTTTLAPLYWIAFATLPVAQTSRLLSQVLRNEFRSWTYSITAILLGMLTLALGMGAALGLGWGIIGILAGTLAAEVIVLCVRVVAVRQVLGHGIDPKFLRPMVRFGAPLVPVTLSFWVFNAANRIVLGDMGSLSSLGYFAVASTVSAAFALLTSAVSQAWVPRAFNLYELDPHAAARSIGRYLTAYVSALGILAVAVSALAPEIISILAPTYGPAARAVPVLCLGAVAFGAQTLTASGLTFKGRSMTLAGLSVFVAAVDILVAISLIPMLGELGAALAGTISYLLLAGLYLWRSQKNWPIILHRKTLALSLVALCVCILGITLTLSQPVPIRCTWLLAYLLAALPAIRLSRSSSRQS